MKDIFDIKDVVFWFGSYSILFQVVILWFLFYLLDEFIKRNKLKPKQTIPEIVQDDSFVKKINLFKKQLNDLKQTISTLEQRVFYSNLIQILTGVISLWLWYDVTTKTFDEISKIQELDNIKKDFKNIYYSIFDPNVWVEQDMKRFHINLVQNMIDDLLNDFNKKHNN